VSNLTWYLLKQEGIGKLKLKSSITSPLCLREFEKNMPVHLVILT
jgi:hypothetical protein